MKSIMFFLTMLFFVGCKNSRGEGVGIIILIPIALGLLSLYSFYRTYLAWSSGATVQDKYGTKDVPGRVNITSIGAFWFGVVFTFAAIVSMIWINADK